MSEPELVRMEISLQGDPDREAEQMDREARQLRSELLEMGLGSVELQKDSLPAGAKAGDGLALGGLVLGLASSSVAPLLDFLKAWGLRRHGRTLKIKAALKNRSVEMELDPATVSLAEVQEMVNAIVKNLGAAGS